MSTSDLGEFDETQRNLWGTQHGQKDITTVIIANIGAMDPVLVIPVSYYGSYLRSCPEGAKQLSPGQRSG